MNKYKFKVSTREFVNVANRRGVRVGYYLLYPEVIEVEAMNDNEALRKLWEEHLEEYCGEITVELCEATALPMKVNTTDDCC